MILSLSVDGRWPKIFVLQRIVTAEVGTYLVLEIENYFNSKALIFAVLVYNDVTIPTFQLTD